MMARLKPKLEALAARVDGLSLRERVLIFAAAAFALVAAIDTFFLDPLLLRQKQLSGEVVQKQEKMKELQAQLAALLEAKQEDDRSPLRDRIKVLRKALQEGEAYLQSRRDRLVAPEKMADLLEQVLSRNSRVQLVKLENLPATPLLENRNAEAAATARLLGQDKQVFKHGVQLTLRGSYGDLLDYLVALEKLPVQMFWGKANLNVVQYPVNELTLTLYTLSLDTIWLQV